jgi:cytidylate kinase
VIVAIDGPAGAGKSTVARAVAEALGIGYLDTGAMYRALTLVALRTGVPASDGAALAQLARENPVHLENGRAGVRVVIRGDDVTAAIREADVTATVSEVAAHPDVRHEMVARQRQVMASGDWVCDGRDIGSVVFPDSQLKFYIDASEEVRAARRRAQGHTDQVAERAVQALRATSLRGQRVVVRRDQPKRSTAAAPPAPGKKDIARKHSQP